MIFVSVGSREYPFDRLLKKLDELVQKQELPNDLFAQIGQSSYLPQAYPYTRFLAPEAFEKYQERADLIISHAGTGALIGALKKGKPVIAVPRLAKYGEHIDDHQLQIAEVLQSQGYLRYVLDMEKLGDAIRVHYDAPIIKRYDRPSDVLKIITKFIEEQ